VYMVCNVTVVGYMFRIVIVVHEKKSLKDAGFDVTSNLCSR